LFVVVGGFWVHNFFVGFVGFVVFWVLVVFGVVGWLCKLSQVVCALSVLARNRNVYWAIFFLTPYLNYK
jgi:hypothetical protein